MRRKAALWLLVVVCACGPGARGEDDVGETDGDGDGYTPTGGDCDDSNAAVNPGAGENCTDTIDNDCNGMTDDADYNCMTPCEKAAYDRSSVGCVYYAVDTNSLGGPYALAVSNVDGSATANVVVEQKTGATWAPVTGGMFSVGPKMVKTLTVPRRFVSGSGILAGGAYRITSDLPVISYQFAPIDGSASFLSDASLLLPASALDKYYIVSAWPYGADVGNTPRPANIQIAAVEPAQVTITSPIASVAGAMAPALQPGVPQTYQLTEGDYLQLTVAQLNQSFTGTYIEATAPVAVFSSNDCANVPNIPSECCCDHLEEQLFGLQTWGKSYVAAQMPRRQTEGSVWQILAQQDATNITFTPSAGVTGLPPSVTLNAREKVEYEVIGGATPGDFLVTSDKPILVNQFTVGAFHVQVNSLLGDPDMVQAVPTEQFLAAYTVLVPATWTNDYLVITRKEGTMVLVDGVPPNVTWNAVPGGWQTGVLSGLVDGVHTLESNVPFGVHVNGYDQYDSYAYPGGLGQTVINPIL
ncbi:MAG TPA: MopE-related protein [Kofleriaceae bacterium]